MTYDQMQSIIELYLAELEKDGIDPCGFPIHEARELLLDFAQWFADDVEDNILADPDSAKVEIDADLGRVIPVMHITYSEPYHLKIFEEDSDVE